MDFSFYDIIIIWKSEFSIACIKARNVLGKQRWVKVSKELWNPLQLVRFNTTLHSVHIALFERSILNSVSFIPHSVFCSLVMHKRCASWTSYQNSLTWDFVRTLLTLTFHSFKLIISLVSTCISISTFLVNAVYQDFFYQIEEYMRSRGIWK